MRSRQLYASVTATTAGAIYFDVPDNTRIHAVQFALAPTSGLASADYILAEVSLSATNQTVTNDAQGVIACVSAEAAVIAAGTGAMCNGFNLTCPVNLPVKKGERIYLNATESGSATWSLRAIVWFD